MSMIPPGFYQAYALEGQYGLFPNTGNTYVKVIFQIIGGDHDGQHVSWTGHFTEKTMQRTIESLQYCGCTFPDNDITNLDGISSQEVSIEVEHEDYEDANGNLRTVARVAWVNRPGAGGVKQEHQLNPAQQASFRDRMKGQLLGLKGGGQQQPAQRTSQPRQAPQPTRQAPPKQRQQQPAAQISEDEIPF